MANTAAKMIMLKSPDGEEFVVSKAVAMQFEVIRHIIENNCGNNSIPLPSVDSKVLVKVIEYCTKHAMMAEHAANTPKTDKAVEEHPVETSDMLLQAEELKNLDEEFLNSVDAIDMCNDIKMAD